MTRGRNRRFLSSRRKVNPISRLRATAENHNFGHNPVEPPSDSTNVTSVGGTTLNTSGGAWASETTWNWFTTPINGLSNNATSGGSSTTYLLPLHGNPGLSLQQIKAHQTFAIFRMWRWLPIKYM